MPNKRTESNKLEQLINNPLLISLVLACVALLIIFLINLSANWPSLISIEPTKQVSQYLLQENYLENTDNDGNLTTKTAASPANLRGPIISNEDPAKGAANAPIVIVYYADFTCSFCKKQEAIFNQALEQYPDLVKVIRKDLPDTNKNSLSYLSAKAGRCAFEQDLFWQFNDLILNKAITNSDDLEKIASQIGLDLPRFKTCYNNSTATAIEKNWQEADALGISGTPYIYVNQRDFLGELSWNDLEMIIQTEGK
jgi:protein-disulfide isomerase